MSFYRKVKYYLVHTLNYTNKDAQKLIDSQKIEIDGKVITDNCIVDAQSEIKVNATIVRKKVEYVYLKFYKPVGFESSLNEKVPNNLSSFFTNYNGLSIAGRLDKQSEGLLLLSNDGKWVEKICHPNFEKEKEYEVKLDKPVDSFLVDSISAGLLIGSYLTKPARCQIIKSDTIRVILREGKNRQIRRMCWKLGYKVIDLKRIRIDKLTTEDLAVGQFLSFKVEN